MGHRCNVCSRLLTKTQGNTGPKCLAKQCACSGIIANSLSGVVSVSEILKSKKPDEAGVEIINNENTVDNSPENVASFVNSANEFMGKEKVDEEKLKEEIESQHQEQLDKQAQISEEEAIAGIKGLCENVSPELGEKLSQALNDYKNNPQPIKTDNDTLISNTNKNPETAPSNDGSNNSQNPDDTSKTSKPNKPNNKIQTFDDAVQALGKELFGDDLESFLRSPKELYEAIPSTAWLQANAQELGLTNIPNDEKSQATLRKKVFDSLIQNKYKKALALYNSLQSQIEKVKRPEDLERLTIMSDRTYECLLKESARLGINFTGDETDAEIASKVKKFSPESIKEMFSVKAESKEKLKEIVKTGGLNTIKVAGKVATKCFMLSAGTALFASSLSFSFTRMMIGNKSKGNKETRAMGKRFKSLVLNQIWTPRPKTNAYSSINKKVKTHEKIQQNIKKAGGLKGGAFQDKNVKQYTKGYSSHVKSEYNKADYHAKKLSETNNISYKDAYVKIGPDRAKKLKALKLNDKAEYVKTFMKTKQLGLSIDDLSKDKLKEVEKRIGKKKMDSIIGSDNNRYRNWENLTNKALGGMYLAASIKKEYKGKGEKPKKSQPNKEDKPEKTNPVKPEQPKPENRR